MVTFGKSTVQTQTLSPGSTMRPQRSTMGTRSPLRISGTIAPRSAVQSYDEAVEIIKPQAPRIYFLQNSENYVNVMHAIAGRRKRLRSHFVESRVDDVRDYLSDKSAPYGQAVYNGVADILLAGSF